MWGPRQNESPIWSRLDNFSVPANPYGKAEKNTAASG